MKTKKEIEIQIRARLQEEKREDRYNLGYINGLKWVLEKEWGY